MAGNILTPSAIWNNFTIEQIPQAEVVSEKVQDGIMFSYFYLDGREIGQERVKIYGVMARKVQQTLSPAILLVSDLDCGFNEGLMLDFAERGYTVLSVDLAGETDGESRFTIYPNSIHYANYQVVKDNLYKVDGDAINTCWFEWACVLKYAFKYLSNQITVTKVGCLGYGEAGTALWQLAGTESELSCAVFALNAGWNGYRGINKFGGMVEPQFDDDMYKFIAGIEPQAYAMHVKCPTLMLSATNSKLYDCDRAYDTLSRIENVRTVMHYSVGCSGKINREGYLNAVNFFELFLKKEGAKADDFPYETDIICDIKDGKIQVEVTPFLKNIIEVELYVAEENNNPSLRCWQKFSNTKKDENGVYRFEYSPYPDSGNVTMFAQAKYKGDLAVGSKIINKKFNKEDVLFAHKTNILYSSRIKNADCTFYSAKQQEKCRLFTDKKDLVIVKKGPMNIDGVTCDAGLLTFKLCNKKDKPSDGAMLMFDVYAEKNSEITVKLIADYFGQKTEYLVKVNLLGGDVWHNVKLETSRFKTCEGMGLKSFEKIQAVEFSVSDGEFLINNFLWL
ncbi:MAG: hypothetical protein E7373_04780 [Clostridiales bacterium]|nr:hypothetical protein [Clostridiales bacterium]